MIYRIFRAKETTITTPYKFQAAAIRSAVAKAVKISPFWSAIDAYKNIKVATTDSMQGDENGLVIYDLVLAKKPSGNNPIHCVIQYKSFLTLCRWLWFCHRSRPFECRRIAS